MTTDKLTVSITRKDGKTISFTAGASKSKKTARKRKTAAAGKETDEQAASKKNKGGEYVV